MILEIVLIIINILSLLIFNKFYFYFNKEKIVFLKYFKNYLFFFFILIFLLILFSKEINIILIQSIIFSNFCIFLFFLFSVSLKSYESPTEFIYKSILKKKNYYKILLSLKKNKIIELRIKDLQKQKLITLKNKSLKLSNLGLKFCKFYSLVMQFFKLSNRG